MPKEKKISKASKVKVETTSISIDEFIKHELQAIDQKLEKIKAIDEKTALVQENKLIDELETKVFKQVHLIKEYEKKVFLKNHQFKIDQLKAIDENLIADYLKLNNLQYINNELVKIEINQPTFLTSENIVNKVFKELKNTRTKALAFELAKTSKTFENETLSFQYGNGFIEYFLFWYLIHKPEQLKQNFTLSSVIAFVNKHSQKQYNSNGHYNYIANKLKSLKAM